METGFLPKAGSKSPAEGHRKMCAEMTLRATASGIQDSLGRSFLIQTPAGESRPEDGDFQWDLHLRLYGPTPVLVFENSKLILREMKFSLKPPQARFSSFNARLASWDPQHQKILKIYHKKSWAKAFRQGRALVPMTGFIEPIYRGEAAGHALEFQREDGELMWVPALYEESVDALTGEVYEGFALILHSAGEFVLNSGHHREVLQLHPEDAVKWLCDQSLSDEELYEFLLTKRLHPELQAHVSRSLVRGWEKRLRENEIKLHKEMDFLRQLEGKP